MTAISETRIIKLGDLPPANLVIQPHWNGDRYCVWSRCKVTRLITCCPAGCTWAEITRAADHPVAASDVADAVLGALDMRTLVGLLNLTSSDGEWLDCIDVSGHQYHTEAFLLTLRDTGQTFTVKITES